MSAEFDFIAALRRATRLLDQDGVLIGIGDDAAVLQPSRGCHLVACVDTLVKGVHYLPDTPLSDVAYKAFAVNLSDMAAMGAKPRWALLSLTLEAMEAARIDSLLVGLAEVAASYQVAVVGGDTTNGPDCFSVTLLGEVPQGAALTRSGAQVGDRVAVTGTLGDAALALDLIQQGKSVPSALSAALHRPQPPLKAGQALLGLASACIDISDGLLADLGHLLKASGVGASVEAAQVPRSVAFSRLRGVDLADPLVLAGGDDYQLCFTYPSGHVDRLRETLAACACRWADIGQIEAQPGLRLMGPERQTIRVAIDGYEHFR